MRKCKTFLWKMICYWYRLGNLICWLLLFSLLGAVVSSVGVPRKLQETCQAAVFLESGEVLTCQLEARGEITRYPFRERTDVDSLSLWAEDRLVVEFEYAGAGPYVPAFSYRYTGLLAREEKTVLAELDVTTLFPEMEEQRCVVAVPALDRAAVVEILEQPAPAEYVGAEFAWFTQ